MISVCLPTYNGAKFIEEQLGSILGQLRSDDEVVISDDGSLDDTVKIVREFNDKRIKLFLNENSKFVWQKYKFSYVTNNLYNALINCTGDYIFLADQDDVWCERKVQRILILLQKYSCVLHDCYVVNEIMEIKDSSYFKVNGSKKGFFKNIYKNSYLGCCMAFKKELLKYVLPFPDRPVPHDIWIGIIAEIYSEVYFCNEQLMMYRRHGLNLSSSSQKSNNLISFKLLYRLHFCIALTKRLFGNLRRRLLSFT